MTERPTWPIDESPEDTLRRVIRNCAIPAKDRHTKTEPRWSVVSQVTAHGSLPVDPHECAAQVAREIASTIDGGLRHLLHDYRGARDADAGGAE